MMPAYVAAQAAAERIHRHFDRHPLPYGPQTGTLPDSATLAALIDTAFWTSLRREELFTPRISLAYASPAQAPNALSFAVPLPLAPKDLTKLAAAVERSGIHLCAWPAREGLQVWGIARHLPPLCLVVETVVPGLLAVKISPAAESAKFLNVAVLQGDEIKILDPEMAGGPHGPAMLASLLRLESQISTGSAVNVLLQLAVSMRAHGRGGTLLVTPSRSRVWRESILDPVPYLLTPPFAGLADLMRKDARGQATRGWEDAMSRAVDGIAGLTAVDGATVITASYQLLAFGAKIVRRKRSRPVSRVILSEPVEDARPRIADSSQLGGTRHLSAAQFAQDQHQAIALVASQDGRFTVFAWSHGDEMVHAHRIDALLL